MSGRLALLAGLYLVPVALLVAGHRLRRRRASVQRAFVGGVIGYLLAAVAATAVGLSPAAHWASDDRLRGAVGLWAPLVAPLIGALLGAMRRGEAAPGDP